NDGLGNGGSSFTASDIPGDTGTVYHSYAADIDDDGDIDIWTLDSASHNKLWLNDGAGNFTASDIANDFYGTAGAIFDYDNDGDLDLYSAIYGVQSNFFINDGEGNGG